jgi:hypothetical protein
MSNSLYAVPYCTLKYFNSCSRNIAKKILPVSFSKPWFYKYLQQVGQWNERACAYLPFRDLCNYFGKLGLKSREFSNFPRLQRGKINLTKEPFPQNLEQGNFALSRPTKNYIGPNSIQEQTHMYLSH